ncbi:MAG: hypothetical protein AAB909_02595 [Patescibacteria group bacterium]
MKKTLTSFVLVAALLPVILFGAVMREKLSFSASADANPVLRIWFEPAALILSPGQSISVKMMMESDAEQRLVGSVHVPLIVSGDVQIDPSKIEFQKPFLGRTEVGNVRVTSLGGSGEVRVDKENVQVLPPDFLLSPAVLKITER